MNILNDISYKDKIRLQKATIFWNNDNILRIVLKKNVHIELNDSKEIFHILCKYSSGKKDMFVLTVASEGCTYDPEVREFSTSEECSRYTYAEAVVTNSLAHKLLINFALKFHKPDRLLKLLTSEHEAMKWLLSCKAQLESIRN